MSAILQLVRALRKGEKFGRDAFKSERHFLDFVVDGQSLLHQLDRGPSCSDHISVLCFEFLISETEKDVDRLLLRSQPELPSGRRSLYICPECGDLGCGAITAVIERDGAAIVWRDFGCENNYETDLLEYYIDVGPFAFDFTKYERILLEGLEQIKSEQKQ